MNNYLTESFQDTQKLLWENPQLQRLTQMAVMCTRVFPERFDTTRVMGSYPTRISVSDETVLQAARRLYDANHKMAIVNCANAVNPGGGVAYGAYGDEEDLCRCSNLYPCLTKPEIFADFYQYNNQMDSCYSDRLIYAEDVTIFKMDEMIPQFTKDWITADVMSCPAPNMNGITGLDMSRLEKLLKARIRNILAVAAAHGVRTLVFGAFGCGTFMNPPQIVASALASQLYEGDYRNMFREVVFAIKAQTPADMYVFETFKEILCPWQRNPLFGRKVSIMGDGLSTYWGSQPSGYKAYYEGDKALRCGVYTQSDMWWSKVLNHFGGQLLVNSSCDDGTVSGDNRYCGNSDLRTGNLHKQNQIPEVIFVFMGMEDYIYGLPLDAYTSQQSLQESYYRYFKPSYEIMLWKLRQSYPNALIYCATLCAPKEPGNNGMALEYNYGMSIDAYNQVIRDCALRYGCQVVDLRSYVYEFETVDRLHPTALGMNQLAKGWINALEDASMGQRTTYLKVEKPKKRKDPLLLIVALICAVLAVGFLTLFTVGMLDSWFVTGASAVMTGIFPVIFIGLTIILFFFYYKS